MFVSGTCLACVFVKHDTHFLGGMFQGMFCRYVSVCVSGYVSGVFLAPVEHANPNAVGGSSNKG